MKTPKERFEELEKEIEHKKSELAKKGKYAQFDYRILVLEAEMKGIADTMEHIHQEKLKRKKKNFHKLTKEDCIKGAKAHNHRRRLPNQQGKFTCSRCKQTKPEEEFNKNISKWNGLDSFCKICRTEYHREWHERKKQYFKERYNNDNIYREKKRQYDQERYKRLNGNN